MYFFLVNINVCISKTFYIYLTVLSKIAIHVLYSSLVTLKAKLLIKKKKEKKKEFNKRDLYENQKLSSMLPADQEESCFTKSHLFVPGSSDTSQHWNIKTSNCLK